MRDLRDVLADVHILPNVVLDVIAEYAVFATVVVHTTARVGGCKPPLLGPFRVYPWNSMRVLDRGIHAQANAPFGWVNGVYFILRYTIEIGNMDFPGHLLGRIQVGQLLHDLGVGWNQILDGEFRVAVSLVRLRVDVLDGAHRGVMLINAVLARAGWPSEQVLQQVQRRHDHLATNTAGEHLYRPHRLTLQDAENAEARELAADSLITREDLPELGE